MLRILVITIFSLMSCFWTLGSEEIKNDREKVIERLQEFGNDFNKGNVQKLGSYWTEDAEIVNPLTGEVVEGNQEITKYLQQRIQQLAGRKINFEVKNIDFPEDDSATVQGVIYVVDNGKIVNRVARKLELVKDNGEWYLDSLKEIQVELPPSSSYENLKNLEWMLGNWKDEDENSSISFNSKWDKHKNFLIQHFAMEVYGLEALEGMQVIGWDAIEKQIRAWVFDSDGGFGSGIWSKTNEGWMVKLSYTLADGKKASATNVYTKIDKNSYTYSSIDRRVDDMALPDIEPVTVVKEE